MQHFLKLLQDLARMAFVNFGHEFLRHNAEFIELAKEMLREKQIIIYAIDPLMQNKIISGGWGGEIKQNEKDFILWADANLGALKTDLVMERELVYSLAPTTSGKFTAKVSMKYKHTGGFDWRTTRYRNYVQLFLPLDSELIKVDGAMRYEKSKEPAIISQGEENGKKWFGTFISIEPGQTGELSFEYYLSPQVVKMIENGEYELLVQKQIGTVEHKLTLNLDFGKNIIAADVAEKPENFGDSSYKVSTDLRLDRVFKVKLD